MSKESARSGRDARLLAWKERKRKASSVRFHAVARLPHHEQILQAAVDRVKKMPPDQVTPEVVSDAILALVMGQPCVPFVLHGRSRPSGG